MRPNLSFEKLAGTLAALGATAIIAGCGGANAGAKATEVAPSSTPSAAAQQSCSANGNCGAGKTPGDKPTDATSAAPTTPSPAAAMPSSTAAAGSTPNATATPTTPPPASAAVAPKPAAKPSAPKAGAPPKAPKAGEASCGAGTCSADPKKKIL